MPPPKRIHGQSKVFGQTLKRIKAQCLPDQVKGNHAVFGLDPAPAQRLVKAPEEIHIFGAQGYQADPLFHHFNPCAQSSIVCVANSV